MLFFFRFGLFALASWYLLDKYKNLIKYILMSIFVTCLLVVFDAFIQHLFSVNLIGYKFNDTANRLSGFFGEELILGSYLSRLAPLFLIQLLFIYKDYGKRGNFKIFLLSTILFLFSYVIFLSGERVAFSYFIITIFFFLVIFKSKKILIYTCLILFTSFILLIIGDEPRLVKTTKQQIQKSFILTEDGKYQLKKIEEIPIEHLKHWKSTLLMARDEPFSGVGPRMFREKCKLPKYNVLGGCATHPHNLYFQLLGETGIFGFLVLISLFIYISKKLLLNLKINSISLSDKKTMVAISSLSIFLHFFPLLPNGNFFNNWINIITFLSFGLFLHFNFKKNV